MDPGFATVMRSRPAIIGAAAGGKTSLLKSCDDGLTKGIGVGFDLGLVLASLVGEGVTTNLNEVFSLRTA